MNPNVLVIRIQPDEGVSLTFEVKPPGPDICVSALSLDFKYEHAFGSSPPEAYETLLEDCIEGNSLIDPIIQAWDRRKPTDFPSYEAGSWGPKQAEDFLTVDGRHWRNP